jgi:glutamate 5-kinase
VQELRFGDNDCLASLLLNLVEAELFVNLTTAGGVYAADPQRKPDAGLLPCVERVRELKLDEVCGAKTSLGTGGMYSKLLAARRAAQLGVPTLILPGREARVITRAFAGEECGTWVRPEAQSVSRRKYWLAYQSDPQGEIEVDEGAAKALLERGSSLLPGGVCRVEGNFQPAALVRVHIRGRTLGVGLTNYSAADLRRIMGRPRIEVAALLGDAHYPEVMHRDNMLLDAAV